MPEISIITPAYNPDPEYLIEAYLSFKENEDWEWIIQFDGKTTYIPEEIVEDERVIISKGFDDKNFGASAARNYALAQTKGRFVRPLDADDCLTEGSLWRSVEALRENPEIGFEFSPALGLQNNKLIDSNFDIREDYVHGKVSPELIDENWRKGNHSGLNFMSCCFNKEKLLATGIWPNLYTWEDVYITLKVGVSYGAFFTSEPGTIYRRHNQSITSKKYSKDMMRARELQAKLIHDSITAHNKLNNKFIQEKYLMPRTVQEVFEDKQNP